MKTETKKKTKRLEKVIYGRALRDPLAGSPACVLVFVLALIYVEFEFSESTRQTPPQKNSRADLPREKKIKKAKCVSNDAERRED